jgi:hypothetical protein
VRRRIFTEAERECLETWLEEGVEDPITLTTLSRIRKGWPELAEDMELMFRAIRKLQRLRRWRGRATGGSGFGLASRRAASVLTRVRSALSTLGASSG